MRERCGPRGRTGGKHRNIETRTILAVGSNSARRGEQQRKRATPVVFVVHLKHGVVCRVLQLQKQNNLVFRSVRCGVPLRTSQPPYFLLFVLCLSTCRCSLIAAFFLPVIGKVLFPSRRPFLLAPLRFLQAIPGDGADEPNKRWLRDGRANRPRNESINHRCMAGQTYMR